MAGARDDATPGPIFFLSHARAPVLRAPLVGAGRPDAPAERFFRDLWFHVAELAGPEIGVRPGFMDRSLQGSEQWAPALMEAVGTCRVFVPLISEPYLRSEWCAREWHAFERRGVRGGHKNTAILPVHWLPLDGAELPLSLIHI